MATDTATGQHAQELRAAVDRFNGEKMSLSSVEELLARIETIADRMDDRANVVALDTFSRKAVG